MKPWLPSLILLGCAHLACGQTITLKNGTIVATKGVRRAGDSIMATVEIPPTQAGGKPATGELGYKVSDIAKVDFPKPYQLQAAADAINAGKAAEALNDLDPVLNYYEPIQDVPGSWWADATLLKIRALVSAGREADAEQLAATMGREASDPDIVRAANVYNAAAIARRGSQGQALQVYESVLSDARRPETLALAAIYKGKLHLAREDWESALLSLLQVPVFYPEQKILMPSVLLGSAQAYIGLRDYPRAKAALAELASTYPATPEGAQGKLESDKLARLEQTGATKRTN